MKRVTVGEWMTKTPLTIRHDAMLVEAHRMMRERRVRHLPVLRAGALVGIVSQRDLYFLETLADVDEGNTRVDEAMTADPFVVRPERSLASVAKTLIEHRWGSAVVADGERILGVFTTTDALRALVGLLAPTPAPRATRAPTSRGSRTRRKEARP